MDAFTRDNPPCTDNGSSSLPQGSLVTYSLPYATSLPLTGRLQGVVLSHGWINQHSHSATICPILYGKSFINEAWGIKFQERSELVSYLRPDLSSNIDIGYGRVASIPTKNQQPCVVPEQLTQHAIQKLIDIIKPAGQKLAQRRRKEFLGYGEIGKARIFPRYQENCSDSNTPILNLTPPEVYEHTGMTLLIRGFSNDGRFNAKYDVGVPTNKWFKEGFFEATDLRVMPMGGTLTQRFGWTPLPAGLRVLKAVGKKLEGLLDADASNEVVRRYNTPRGDMKRYFKPTGWKSDSRQSGEDCHPG